MNKLIIFCFILILHVKSDINKLCVTIDFFEKINKEDLDKKTLEDFIQVNTLNTIDNQNSKILKIKWKGRDIEIKKMHSDFNHEEEINLLKNFSGNKYFPEYYGCIYDKNDQKNVYIMMQDLYTDLKTSRLDFLRQKTPYQRVDFYIEFAKALQKIQREGYIHGDVSPSNLMVTDGTFNNLKLIDFGVSVKIGSPSKGGTLLTNSPEKNEYPEILATSSIDVFAYGITIAFIELGYNKIIENNWDMRVGNILKFFRIFTFGQLNKANPMHIDAPGFFTKWFNWFIGLFIDNRKDTIYNMNDLINNTISTEPEERLNLESIIEILKKFQEFHIKMYGTSEMSNNINLDEEKDKEKQNNKEMENLLFEKVHNDQQEEFQKKIEKVARESEKKLEEKEEWQNLQNNDLIKNNNLTHENEQEKTNNLNIENEKEKKENQIMQNELETKMPIIGKSKEALEMIVDEKDNLNKSENKKLKIAI